MITVEPFQKENLQQIIEIDKQIWNPTNTPVANSEKLGTPEEHYYNTNVLVAKNDDNKVVGYIEYNSPSKLKAARYTWEFGIGVDPNFQHQHIGTNLIEGLKDEAIKQNIHKIALRVFSTNPNAIAFYKKNGFTIEGTLKDEFFVDNHFVDDIRMSYFI
ncbi:GNAT family N-acetyltransferase [Pediococcus argentinicus]|uniref:N-acetyltransferase domain-containing protein n=1 Tax=Pediococcus argentinicus TaxID=480391 RepID=A0A0R2NBU9_9LACO|nr:GNAT family N-acetyltransferase [Pediococcus argentinicus]KRO23368.1 hypothetical protein IV88_GL001004 [Pediococcus argentinicus]NKZ22920.1 GNAT family N-acetyltransferase [Pediococcus argentinicus]GEP19959.1 hypothetical protein LSA03_13430 [Pediococcus argentinicus]